MSRMAEEWSVEAADLGLTIIAPFRLILPDGRELEFDALLKNFGYKNGTLLTSNHDIWDHREAIIGLGYGWSIMGEYSEHEVYDRAGYIEVLADWGWSGPESSKPNWLPDPPIDDDE